ncbi:MAG: transcription antitermination factor NusB [Acidimicrobiales bacterium]|nr:transcription antitermination factor NusB [Acidimicrobiales bacterium]
MNEGIAKKRLDRERALAIFYKADILEISPIEALSQEQGVSKFSAELINIYSESATKIDSIIVSSAQGWAIGRMPIIDRAILRMEIGELLSSSETPKAVVISEAVELASIYSTDSSSRFINGIMAAVAQELENVGTINDQGVQGGSDSMALS